MVSSDECRKSPPKSVLVCLISIPSACPNDRLVIPHQQLRILWDDISEFSAKAEITDMR